MRRQQRSSGEHLSDVAVRALYVRESTEYLRSQLEDASNLIEYITRGGRSLVYHVSDDALLHVAQGRALSDDELGERGLVNELNHLISGTYGHDSMERGVISENTERKLVLWGAQDPWPDISTFEIIQANRELFSRS